MERPLTLELAVLCSYVLQKPIMILSEDISRSLQRVNHIIESWNVSLVESYIKVNDKISYWIENGGDTNSDMCKHIRRDKYPLILFKDINSAKDITISRQMMITIRDDINLTINGEIGLDIINLDDIRDKISNITLTIEVRAYIYDIIVELRYSRFVKGGLPTYILFNLIEFIKFWAFINDRTYITPRIVKTCCQIILPECLNLTLVEEDPTLMYGSEIKLINQLNKIINNEDIVEIALLKVKPPI